MKLSTYQRFLLWFAILSSLSFLIATRIVYYQLGEKYYTYPMPLPQAIMANTINSSCSGSRCTNTVPITQVLYLDEFRNLIGDEVLILSEVSSRADWKGNHFVVATYLFVTEEQIFKHKTVVARDTTEYWVPKIFPEYPIKVEYEIVGSTYDTQQITIRTRPHISTLYNLYFWVAILIVILMILGAPMTKPTVKG